MLTFSSPQLSPSTAHLLSLIFSATYVGSIYVSSYTRLSFNHITNVAATSSTSGTSTSSVSSNGGGPREKLKDERWRDDPDVIKARLVAVSLATVVCCSALYALLHHLSASSPPVFFDLFVRLGFTQGLYGTWKVIRPHLVTPVLYFGPLYATYLNGTIPGQRYWSWEMHIRRGLWSWQGIRNVIVAPATEEIVFRGCILSVLHLAGVSKTQLMFLSPLSFGLAHVHHAWDTFNRYGRTSQAAIRAATVTLFQLTYTTLFGCYTSYLFLRTSSIYPAISAHAFCNFMGFPRIGHEMSMFPRRKKPIAIAYIIGIAGFIYVLPTWTCTKDSFYWTSHVGGRLGDIY